ncbi:MAG TPA: pitrilysin family protein [Pyrinomonadaceae bacterium]|nr:pitrilysin family protein [Pyrinomonadaceae bacterium]
MMETVMNRKKLSIALCVVLCGLFGATPALLAQQTPPAKQTPPEGGPPRAFTLPKKETFTLKNGMRVTLVPYGVVPKVTVSARVRAGNLNESAEQVWLSVITGSMLKEGTTTRTAEQIAQEAARMGTGINVGVGADQTSLTGDVLAEFGPQLVALLADIMQRPTLPASELARMKNDRLRQLSIARTQPGALANERFRQLLYPNHPYGRMYPTEAMINAYTIEDIQKFYRDNFGAARTNLYVAGRFDAAAMRKAITQAFEGWARGSDPLTSIPKPVSTRGFGFIDRPGATQSTIYLGLPILNPANPDYVALQVTDALLGGSFASRITSNIRESKGYTYSPYSQVSTRYRDAYWVQIADVTTNVTGPSLKEIFYEIERLQKTPPTAEELQGIKNYLAGVFVLQNSSRVGVINQLAFADLHGLDDNFLNSYVQKIFAVTPQDVQRIARTHMVNDRMTLVVVGDKSKIAEQLTPYGKVE